jgi:hypothetical protein
MIPALFCAGVLCASRSLRSKPYYFFIFAICVGTILKASYNFVFANYWHQAPWYYATEFCILNILAALTIKRTIPNVDSRSGIRILWAIYLLFYVVSFSKEYSVRLLTPIELTVSFWKDRGIIEHAIRKESADNKIIEFGDGLVNFALNIPTMHGFVFAADPQALHALQSSTLLELALKRGFDVITSFNYLPWDPSISSSDAIRARMLNSPLDARVKAELDKFDFELIYVYEPSKSPFIKFRIKSPSS